MKYKIKIIPKSAPNSDGEWREVERSFDDLPRMWRATEILFNPHVPDTHFLAQVERVRSPAYTESDEAWARSTGVIKD